MPPDYKWSRGILVNVKLSNLDVFFKNTDSEMLRITKQTKSYLESKLRLKEIMPQEEVMKIKLQDSQFFLGKSHRKQSQNTDLFKEYNEDIRRIS